MNAGFDFKKMKKNVDFDFRSPNASQPKPAQMPQAPQMPQIPQMPQQAWKPEVKPVGQMPSAPTQAGQTFTKTSLAANVPVSHKFVIFVFVLLIFCFCLLFCFCLEACATSSPT